MPESVGSLEKVVAGRTLEVRERQRESSEEPGILFESTVIYAVFAQRPVLRRGSELASSLFTGLVGKLAILLSERRASRKLPPSGVCSKGEFKTKEEGRGSAWERRSRSLPKEVANCAVAVEGRAPARVLEEDTLHAMHKCNVQAA